MKYHCPKTFEDAAQIAADATGVIRYLAGGTDVLVQMRAGMVTPDDMIDLKHIPGVKEIVKNADGSWTSALPWRARNWAHMLGFAPITPVSSRDWNWSDRPKCRAAPH